MYLVDMKSFKEDTSISIDKPGYGWDRCSFDELEAETFEEPAPTFAMVFWQIELDHVKASKFMEWKRIW